MTETMCRVYRGPNTHGPCYWDAAIDHESG